MNSIALNEKVSKSELKRLTYIQGRLSTSIGIPLAKIQGMVSNYFKAKNPQTFTDPKKPKNGDGDYGEETYDAIISFQSDMVQKGFMPPNKKSGKSSIDALYGPLTNSAYVSALKIGAIRGSIEPRDKEGLTNRIAQLEKFIETAPNKLQKAWANGVLSRLKGLLAKLTKKPSAKKSRVVKIVKKTVKQAANLGKIEFKDMKNWVEWIMVQIAAKNITLDSSEGQWKTKKDPTPITQAYLAKKRKRFANIATESIKIPRTRVIFAN